MSNMEMEAAPPILHFLVSYDIRAGRASVIPFQEDYDAAIAAYTAHEEDAHDDPNLDIVLLSADSLETIQRTHSSYFETETFESLLPDGILEPA